MHFLAARKIVRDIKISIANNHILTILSKNSKQTRTFYNLKIGISRHLSIQVLAVNKNLVRITNNIQTIITKPNTTPTQTSSSNNKLKISKILIILLH